MATFKTEHFGTPRPSEEGQYIADRNLYLDAEDNLVEEDDPAQYRQLVGKGGALSNEQAKKYGLLGKKAKAETAETEGEADGEKASSPSANKAVNKSAKNKGAKT